MATDQQIARALAQHGGGKTPATVPAPVPEGAPGPLSPPRYGWVRLRTVDKRHDVAIRMDNESAKLKSQMPRVESVDIPWRAARSWWAGQTAAELLVPCVLDGWPSRGIDEDMETIEAIARPVSAGRATGGPSPLQVAGNVPGADRLWLLTDIEEGQAIWRHGYRVRQHLWLSFSQWLPLERAATIARSNPRTAAGKQKRRPPVRVVKGDTLATIAARELGSSKKWRDIAKLNPRGTGKAKKPRKSPTDLRVGELLKLPQD